MIFQAGNVYESASLFNWKEKKIDMKGGRFWTHDLENLVYHANHQMDGGEIFKYIEHQPQPKKRT